VVLLKFILQVQGVLAEFQTLVDPVFSLGTDEVEEFDVDVTECDQFLDVTVLADGADRLELSVLDPGGIERGGDGDELHQTSYIVGRRFALHRTRSRDEGRWRVRVRHSAERAPEETRDSLFDRGREPMPVPAVSGAVAVRGVSTLRLAVTTAESGGSLHVLAKLTVAGVPVSAGAHMLAVVSPPDSIQFVVPLVQGDGGRWTAALPLGAGTHTVTVKASGVSPLGHRFHREEMRSYTTPRIAVTRVDSGR